MQTRVTEDVRTLVHSFPGGDGDEAWAHRDRCSTRDATFYGVVQGSHLGLDINDSTFRNVQAYYKAFLDVQTCVLDILGCSYGVLHTDCESSIFQTLRDPVLHAVFRDCSGTSEDTSDTPDTFLFCSCSVPGVAG